MKTGYKHQSHVVDARRDAVDQRDCEGLCRDAQGCQTFSYRYERSFKGSFKMSHSVNESLIADSAMVAA